MIMRGVRRSWRSFRKYFKINISEVKLPWGLGSIAFAPDSLQKKAAWDLYVELTTRVATQRLDPTHGLLREALASMHKLFEYTRSTLHTAGFEVAHEFGPVALAVLNRGIRPFLARWHPLLQSYEAGKPADISAYDYERAWEHYALMRKELNDLQNELREYARALAVIAGVDADLHDKFMTEEMPPARDR